MMTYTSYDRPFRKPSELLGDLQDKGLHIDDFPAAERTLTYINYYRFKIYLRPFIGGDKRFVAGASFEDGLALYRFDEELRNQLFSVIGRLEVKFRTRLDQVVTQHTMDSFWYLDDRIVGAQAIRKSLSSYFIASKDDYAVAFKKAYINDRCEHFKHLPPFWILGEMATFGQISMLYQAMKKPAFADTGGGLNKLDGLAQEFGAKNLKDLNSWLLQMRDVRNLCAHHSRTWNRNIRQAAGVNRGLSIPPENANRIYLVCVLLHRISKKVGMDLDIKASLQKLFNQYPVADAHKASAGFPAGWESDVSWS